MTHRHVSTRVPSNPREAAAENRNSENHDRETHDRAGVGVHVGTGMFGGLNFEIRWGNHGNCVGIRVPHADACAPQRDEMVHPDEADHHEGDRRNTDPQQSVNLDDTHSLILA